MLIITLLSQ